MRRYTMTGLERPAVALEEGVDRAPGRGEIAIDLRAASLNYRDLVLTTRIQDVVPLSDGAGVVASVGADVETFAVGDRIVLGFMPGWVEGEFTAEKQATAFGGPGVDGVLTERIIVPATAAVHIPATLSFEEAATLPCAGVTAWSALFERRPVQPGETVLLLGTGGVSIFALQLAKAAGARVIITSSSDEKLSRAKVLGADHIINYRTKPDWEMEVLRLTEGIGADLAVDTAGPATLNKTLQATRHGGRISLMGVLTGFDGRIDTGSILNKRITLQGIYVGSIAALRKLVQVGLKPHVDRVFRFEEANAAYDAFREASHFGKLVIQISR